MPCNKMARSVTWWDEMWNWVGVRYGIERGKDVGNEGAAMG